MATSATPRLREVARRLLAYEAAASQPADATDSAAFRLCEKLRGPLGKLFGVGGFRSLLARALTLGSTEAPLLRALRINADGSVDGLSELEAELDPRMVLEAEAALVAQLLGLLVTFIGPTLTLGLMQDAWPKADFDDLRFGKKETP